MSNRASSCSSPLTTRDAEVHTIAPDRVLHEAHTRASDVLRGVPRAWTALSATASRARLRPGFGLRQARARAAAPCATFRL